jgi:hypothetical protein
MLPADNTSKIASDENLDTVTFPNRKSHCELQEFVDQNGNPNRDSGLAAMAHRQQVKQLI